MIYLILINTFSGVLPAFTCTGAIGNVWGICLGVTTLRCETDSKGNPIACVGFIENIPNLKALRVDSRPL